MSGTRTRCGFVSLGGLDFSTASSLFAIWLAVICVLLAQRAAAQSYLQDLQPVLLSPKHLTNGFFTFEVGGASNRTYLIEASTNLVDWQDLLPTTLITNPAPYTDQTAVNLRRRFYRAKLFQTLIITNPYATWTSAEGLDGHQIAFPSAWVTNQGYDGRMVAYPSTWTATQGLDGRMIAEPPGWTNGFGADARMAAWPSPAFTNISGTDGRLITLPAENWTNVAGADARLVAAPVPAFRPPQGADGRVVAGPFFNSIQGADGRLVGYTSPGWLIAGGPDGRDIFYSRVNFATTNGADGRVIAYPASGWRIVQGEDGRMAAYPTNSPPTLEINFQDQAYLGLLNTLTNVLSASDLNDYIIYSYFVAEDQGQYD